MFERFLGRGGQYEDSVPEPVTVRVDANGHDDEKPRIPEDFWRIDRDAVLHPPAGLSYELSLDTFFNAEHYVTMDGTEGPVHSHSYRLQVRCRGRTLKEDDHVVVGYQPVRERVKEVVHAYNGELLNELPPFQSLQPTTENLAAVLFQQLARILGKLSVELTSVTVWESPTESITYYRR